MQWRVRALCEPLSSSSDSNVTRGLIAPASATAFCVSGWPADNASSAPAASAFAFACGPDSGAAAAAAAEAAEADGGAPRSRLTSGVIAPSAMIWRALRMEVLAYTLITH